MNTQNNLLDFRDVLRKLEESDQENHLLLGNGFNISIGILTNYDSIFQEMKKKYEKYQVIEDKLKEYSYDIEKLICWLKERQPNEGHEYSNHDFRDNFIDEYIENNIKSDFMKAVWGIVEPKIKNIYKDQEKSDKIYSFFKTFKSYYTLNYDPVLYLLLLQYKIDDEVNKSPHDNQPKLNSKNNQKIFNDLGINNYLNALIDKLQVDGKFVTDFENGIEKEIAINNSDKQETRAFLRIYLRDKIRNTEIKIYEIEKAVDRWFANEEKGSKSIEINDGFVRYNKEEDPIYHIDEQQNIFYPHGAFHIIRLGKKILKISQTNLSQFRTRLEETILQEMTEFICVLASESEDKMNQINNNNYLRHSLNSIKNIMGNMVIFGCSFSENDCHIFNKFKHENINKYYVSTSKSNNAISKKRIEKILPANKVEYFDYETVKWEEIK